MAEAVERQATETTPRRSPLEGAQAGAALRAQDGCVVVATYGDARA